MIEIICVAILFVLLIFIAFLPTIVRNRALKKLRDQNYWDMNND